MSEWSLIRLVPESARPYGVRRERWERRLGEKVGEKAGEKVGERRGERRCEL